MSFRRIQSVTSFAFLLFLCTSCGAGQSRQIQAYDQACEPSGRQCLTPNGEALLHSLIDAAKLPDLHRPNFSAYQNEVKEFYKSLDGSLGWIRRSKPTLQARALIHTLDKAVYKGLRPEDYDSPQWDERLALIEQTPTVSESDLVNFDLALTVSGIRYISDLRNGRVNPRLFHFDFNIDHTKFDLPGFLTQDLVNSQNVDAALALVEPTFPVYRRTEEALKIYLELARRDEGGVFPIPSKTIKIGDPYPAVPLLARKLALLGDIPEEHGSTDKTYNDALVNGVKHFQRRHGLEPNGLIDTATVKELNTPLSRRVMQLRLTLERLRWLPHGFDRPPIVVNIPEFRLHADNEDYRWVLSMKVVVGVAYEHQTPVFASVIKSVIFRPYWDVPSSILESELLPHLKKNPFYLAQNSYEIVDRKGMVVSEGIVNEAIEEKLRLGDLRVRQKPGPENSLGLVKFDIPSPYDVYMHGTPATELFSRSRRDFSHGCIRVEDPVALAQWVLRDQLGWSEDSIRAAMNGEQTLQVKLDRPIPVLILYSTAVVMEDGELRYFDDIYGQDATLERALSGEDQ
jgi:murein L,D-transpeptidase YcbB/YkuD